MMNNCVDDSANIYLFFSIHIIVGFAVGSNDGFIVGFIVGFIDGLFVGLLVGDIIGLMDGAIVGSFDGNNDGFMKEVLLDLLMAILFFFNQIWRIYIF